jgi:hypothetical protein
MSKIQIIGIGIAVVILLILVASLVITRRKSPQPAPPVAQPPAPPPVTSETGSFLDEAPRDELHRLGKAVVSTITDEVPGAEAQAPSPPPEAFQPVPEASTREMPAWAAAAAPAATVPMPAPSAAAEGPQAEPAQSEATEGQAEQLAAQRELQTFRAQPVPSWANPAARREGEPHLEPADENGEPPALAEDLTAASVAWPAEQQVDSVPQPGEEPLIVQTTAEAGFRSAASPEDHTATEGAVPAEVATEPRGHEQAAAAPMTSGVAAAERGEVAIPAEPSPEEAPPGAEVPATPGQQGPPSVEEQAQQPRRPQTESRLVSLSDIIVTTNDQQVDLSDPEVRRMLKDLVQDEIDLASQYRQLGQNVDAVLQLTEAERICIALGMSSHAKMIRQMIKELQE